MRAGFDGLLALVRKRWTEDPLAGHLFCFVSKRADRVKIIWWSSGGLSMYCKRLENGRFRLPKVEPGQRSVRLGATDLAMLLDGIDWSRVRRPQLYQPPGSLADGGSTTGSEGELRPRHERAGPAARV
jgi:transposase